MAFFQAPLDLLGLSSIEINRDTSCHLPFTWRSLSVSQVLLQELRASLDLKQVICARLRVESNRIHLFLISLHLRVASMS